MLFFFVLSKQSIFVHSADVWHIGDSFLETQLVSLLVGIVQSVLIPTLPVLSGGMVGVLQIADTNFWFWELGRGRTRLNGYLVNVLTEIQFQIHSERDLRTTLLHLYFYPLIKYYILYFLEITKIKSGKERANFPSIFH